MSESVLRAGGNGRKQYRQNSAEEGHRRSSSSLFQAQGSFKIHITVWDNCEKSKQDSSHHLSIIDWV
ncbi:hypothetical protein ACFX14_036782 [Malus domestica]